MPLDALSVQVHSETNVSLARWVSEVVRQCSPGHWTGDGETPDGRVCCDDVVVRWDGGVWKIEVADDWQRPMWGGSSSRGTGEPCLWDTGELSLRAYGRFVAEHRASAARSGADVSSLGQISQYYWQHGLRHSANVVTCQWWFLATRPTRYCNHQYAMWWRHAQVFADSASSNRRILRIWLAKNNY